LTLGDVRVSAMSALRQSIGVNQMMAYLVMMAARLRCKSIACEDVSLARVG
jgi:hypothetical protein